MDLFTPFAIGPLLLRNRIVMAPMTRRRADPDGTPTPLQAEYYAQRADLGLIVTEGAYPVPESRGYTGQPGIVDDRHAAGWSRVADAVHDAGGKIALQLMHAGRVSHPDVTGTDRIVAPSAIPIAGDVHTPHGALPYPEPHALTIPELADVGAEFAAAARRAIDAGMDAVELHGANGYLLHQFLAPSSNRRTDGYGGTPERRARFVIEVVAAVAEAIGAERLGIRFSPGANIQDVLEPDPADLRATYLAVADGIAPLGLGYLSVVHPHPESTPIQELRARVGAPLIANTGFSTTTTRERVRALIADGAADAVAVGRPVIANPDLAERWRRDLPENAPDPQTFYTGGATGFADYPRSAALRTPGTGQT
ncbi:2,4-dienoyl-CoA reductase-like NADH-dependent reductase (Old Yellow Enzyme family) [Microbacterium resistens]|uniref:2,4-dienoyl-CoA reductase-like NADH-dependent reductase (Old Yellow Enzyme family) n=1 Tax=Microbacterium resistens TaxID=156977 RepID=A0ABU1SAN3_9MICO|nr:alkene reductase [Microbacterium resistens]MDR6865912.1 2,4-dienoyl-CoA reductase-like NADH-dependent reductase (Old Yellow Enzyme family) [Microbacterium resistens]